MSEEGQKIFTEGFVFEVAVDFIAGAGVGFRHMEVYSDIPHAWPPEFGQEKRRWLKRRAEEARLSMSVHSPAYGLNIASLNPGLWRESIGQIISALRLASDIEARHVVIHGGTVHFLHEAMWEETTRASREAALAALVEIAREAEKLGVTVCLENTCGKHGVPGTLAEAAWAVGEIGCRSLRVALDIAHFHSNKEPVDSLRQAVPLIEHVHISDNNGSDDAHLPLGEGRLDLRPFAEFLRAFEGPVVLEIEHVKCPGEKALESKKWLESRLAELYKASGTAS